MIMGMNYTMATFGCFQSVCLKVLEVSDFYTEKNRHKNKHMRILRLASDPYTIYFG